MVKGTNRQVIVVHSPEPRIFEQAIFILKENAAMSGITDEVLLKEAQQVIHNVPNNRKPRKLYCYGAFWAGIGACVTGLIWLTASLI